jgi:hypothetical protein
MELADENGKRLGLDRRKFLRTSCGMAAAFLAMKHPPMQWVYLRCMRRPASFLLAGFYPAYIVFLKGLDPATTKTE